MVSASSLRSTLRPVALSTTSVLGKRTILQQLSQLLLVVRASKSAFGGFQNSAAPFLGAASYSKVCSSFGYARRTQYLTLSSFVGRLSSFLRLDSTNKNT